MGPASHFRRPQHKFRFSHVHFDVLKTKMKAVQSLQRVFVRGMSLKVAPGTATRGSTPNHEAYRKMQDLQNHFLRDDGLLVWQKRGARDRVPYLLSIMACIAGGASALHNLIVMSFPPKIE